MKFNLLATRLLLAVFASLSASVVLGDDKLTSSISKVFTNPPAIELYDLGKWNEHKTVFMVHVASGVDSILYVFIEQESGDYLPVNLSYRVNNAFDGKLGRPRDFYDTYVQYPSFSPGRGNYLAGVEILTRAWKGGQRYTVHKKATLFTRNGKRLDP